MFRNTTKKRTVLKNFQEVVQHDVNYPHRLNFYTTPPHSEITLEEFELWAIDRLYGQSFQSFSVCILTSCVVLGEIESSLYRNKSQKDMEIGLKHFFEKYLPLNSNTAQAGRGAQLDNERKKDHYSHFILRLAFCRSYALFFRAES
jgi:DNA primase large subunit